MLTLTEIAWFALAARNFALRLVEPPDDGLAHGGKSRRQDLGES